MKTDNNNGVISSDNISEQEQTRANCIPLIESQLNELVKEAQTKTTKSWILGFIPIVVAGMTALIQCLDDNNLCAVLLVFCYVLAIGLYVWFSKIKPEINTKIWADEISRWEVMTPDERAKAVLSDVNKQKEKEKKKKKKPSKGKKR